MRPVRATISALTHNDDERGGCENRGRTGNKFTSCRHVSPPCLSAVETSPSLAQWPAAVAHHRIPQGSLSLSSGAHTWQTDFCLPYHCLPATSFAGGRVLAFWEACCCRYPTTAINNTITTTTTTATTTKAIMSKHTIIAFAVAIAFTSTTTTATATDVQVNAATDTFATTLSSFTLSRRPYQPNRQHLCDAHYVGRRNATLPLTE